MKDLSIINEEIDRLVQIKNKIYFEPGPHKEYIEEVEPAIVTLYDAKNIIQNNTVSDAIKVINDKIKHLTEAVDKINNGPFRIELSRHRLELYNEINFWEWILEI